MNIYRTGRLGGLGEWSSDVVLSTNSICSYKSEPPSLSDFKIKIIQELKICDSGLCQT